MPNPNLINPKVLAIMVFANLSHEAGTLAFQVSQHVIEQAQLRASNFALQYGAMFAAGAAAKGIADPTLPLKYFQETVKTMSGAASAEEAAFQGVIALSALTLSGCASADNTASLAYGGLIIALCQQVFFPGSQSVLSILSIQIYIIKKILIWVITEIKVERERRKLKLPYVNIFRMRKRKPQTFVFAYPRIKRRKIKVFSKNFMIPTVYQKKLRIESPAMVQVLEIKGK